MGVSGGSTAIVASKGLPQRLIAFLFFISQPQCFALYYIYMPYSVFMHVTNFFSSSFSYRNMSTSALIERIPSKWPRPQWRAPWKNYRVRMGLSLLSIFAWLAILSSWLICLCVILNSIVSGDQWPLGMGEIRCI